MAVSKDTVTYAPRVLHFSAFHFPNSSASLFFFLSLSLFSLEPCISKTVNSANLKLCTQVGFHDGLQGTWTSKPAMGIF